MTPIDAVYTLIKTPHDRDTFVFSLCRTRELAAALYSVQEVSHRRTSREETLRGFRENGAKGNYECLGL